MNENETLNVVVPADEFQSLESGDRHFIVKPVSRLMRERLFQTNGTAKPFESTEISMLGGNRITAGRPRIHTTTRGEKGKAQPVFVIKLAYQPKRSPK